MASGAPSHLDAFLLKSIPEKKEAISIDRQEQSKLLGSGLTGAVLFQSNCYTETKNAISMSTCASDVVSHYFLRLQTN
jgi:hypothetical protein